MAPVGLDDHLLFGKVDPCQSRDIPASVIENSLLLLS